MYQFFQQRRLIWRRMWGDTRGCYFFMCEGPIRVEQILAGCNRRFWELSFSLNFLEYKRAVGFLGFDRLETDTPKNGKAAKSHPPWTRAEPARNTKQSALTKRAFCRPLHPLGLAFFSRLLKIPKPTRNILDCRSGIWRGDWSIILNIDSKPNLASLVFFSLYLGPPSGDEQ